MEAEIIKILTNGGGIGIAITVIIYSWFKDKLYNKTINNHLEHSREIDMRFIEAINGLKGVIAGCSNNKLNKK